MKKTQTIFLFFLIIFLSNCRKEVETNFIEFEKAYCLNSLICIDSTISVHLSQTDNLNSTPLKTIDNDSIILKINTSSYILNNSNNGIYSISQPLNENDSIEIIYREISAKTIIPKSPSIQKVNLIENGYINDDGEISPSVMIDFNDIESKFYFEVIVHDIEEHHNYNDSLPTIYEYKRSLGLFNSKETDNPLKLDITNMISYNNEILIIEIRALSESYYEYAKSLEAYEIGRFPVFGIGSIAPVNLYSNVNNGYGILASYSSYYSDTLKTK